MGKLFGESVQNVTQTGNIPTCGQYMQGCGHGHHHGCSNSMPNNAQNFPPSCMGRCNPPKLYTDTYNYLNENLMQPTINEVYNDLKSITPANTIMNNPVAQQLGLSIHNSPVQPTMSSVPHQMEKQNGLSNLNTGNIVAASSLNSNNNMGQMHGMGPQIINMFGENQATKANNMVQQAKPIALPTSNQYNYNKHTALIAQPQNTNHLSHQLIKQQPMENIQPVGNMNTSSGLPQQTPPNNHHHHVQHAQGMQKFKEMFPAVMKSDLGFDPMEIAIQMNPANQKKVAVDTIHKMMNNNNINSALKTNDIVHSGLNGSISNQYNTQANQIQGNVFSNEVLQSNVLHQQKNQQMQLQQQPVANIAQINNQPIIPNQQVSQPSNNPYAAYIGQTNLNTSTALSNSPLPNQQQQSSYYQQYTTDPNSNVIGQSNLPTVYEGFSSNKIQNQPEISNAQPIIKEPILPADTSKFVKPKQKYYEFNTLGQPIDILPADVYYSPVPDLPQTLSPQDSTNPRNDFTKYSNVKSTISKTSLMGIKPIGKTPSRNQLQHIYNQYKGSQSFTHQNIRDQFNKDISRSDGRLNVPHVNLTAQHVPIENVGGDTAANNQLNIVMDNKIGHKTEQIGDAPLLKQTNNGAEKVRHRILLH